MTTFGFAWFMVKSPGGFLTRPDTIARPFQRCCGRRAAQLRAGEGQLDADAGPILGKLGPDRGDVRVVGWISVPEKIVELPWVGA